MAPAVGGEALRWPACRRQGSRLIFPPQEPWRRHGEGQTWPVGRREEDAAVGILPVAPVPTAGWGGRGLGA